MFVARSDSSAPFSYAHVAPPTLNGSVGDCKSRSHDYILWFSLDWTPYTSTLLKFYDRCWFVSFQRKVGVCPGPISVTREEVFLKDKLSQQERSNSSWVRRRRRRSCDEGEGWGVIEEQSCRRRKLQVLFLWWEISGWLLLSTHTHTHMHRVALLLLTFVSRFFFLDLFLLWSCRAEIRFDFMFCSGADQKYNRRNKI